MQGNRQEAIQTAEFVSSEVFEVVRIVRQELGIGNWNIFVANPSADELQALEVLFGPAGLLDHALQGLGRERVG